MAHTVTDVKSEYGLNVAPPAVILKGSVRATTVFY